MTPSAPHQTPVLRLVLLALARTLLVTLGGLLLWTVLPMVLGWQPTVVMSGSMQPKLQPGDVVVVRDVSVTELNPGHVLLVDDPDRPDTLRLHRWERTTPEGLLVLRGDANAEPDSTPVRPAAVHGVGVLRVPWVGSPVVWLAEGRYLPLAAGGLALAVLLAVAAQTPERGRGSGPAGAPSPPTPGSSTGRSRTSRASVGPVACTAVALTVLLSSTTLDLASAAFSASTSTGATFSAGPF